jgi:predicted lipoprotein with Yx(FWY)xxD motif
MRFAKHIVATLLLALAAGTGALANPAVPAPGAPPIRKLDGHLVDLKGRGLYMWDGDVAGDSSQCNSQCRLLWPPLFADDNAVPKGPFNLVKRDDGRYQWALNGRPLYRWTSDKKWGDAGGDGVADMWHLVKVAAPKAKDAQ